MKKILVIALAVSTMMLTAVSSFAAEPFVCPNGNQTCITNGYCANNGDCPNGGVPLRNGTGHHNGGHGYGHGGRGHCR